MSKKSKKSAARETLRPRAAHPQHAEISRLLPLYDIGGQSYFGYRMVLAAKLFDRRIMEILDDSGILTLPQWRVVSQLGLTAHGTVRSLADGAAVDRAEASRATRELVHLGLVHRRENGADKRSPTFELTDAGRKSFGAIRKPISKFIEHLVEGLNRKDLEAANRVLWAITLGCLK
jgi:DNA-binding MarR family transcriptional regulator